MAVRDIEFLTIDDMKPITISFKKNEDELVLYKWILKHSGHSGFIKDILKREMNGETKESVSVKLEDKNNNLIELDF